MLKLIDVYQVVYKQWRAKVTIFLLLFKWHLLESLFYRMSSYVYSSIESNLIDKLVDKIDIDTIENFNALKIEDKAILDAYLKRFSSVQDFLGAKIFPHCLILRGLMRENERGFIHD